MVPRHPQRVEARVTRRVTAHNHHGTVQRNIWTLIESHKSWGHKTRSPPGNVAGITKLSAIQTQITNILKGRRVRQHEIPGDVIIINGQKKGLELNSAQRALRK